MSQDQATESRHVPEKVGPYRLGSQLGAGGMGEVYRAYDERLDRWVAIKHILPRAADTPTARARLRREARTVARLSHPAIVQIFDILEAEDGDWIVSELIEGKSVRELVETTGPLDLAQVVSLGRQVADGLAEAHSKGIVHRDLKAENVMVTPAGHAKILDFGIAKQLAPLTEETTLSVDGAIVGTCRAMSPEQAQGEKVDHRSDLFSLGTVLYEALTGKSPFMGANPLQTLSRIASHRQRPARELRREVPEELSELVDRLLEKEPAARPQSAEKVTEALIDVAGGLDVERRGPGVLAPVPAADRSIAAEVTGSGRPAGRPLSGTDLGPTRVGTMGTGSGSITVKTLLAFDLVDRAQRVTTAGEESEEQLTRHDAMARDLVAQFDGHLIDEGAAFIVLFDRPFDAVDCALAYQEQLAKLARELGAEMSGRAGIHLGEVILPDNPPEDLARGARPVEVEGVARPVAVRTMSMARGGQTLVTQGAFELSRRATTSDHAYGRKLTWMAHGRYRFTGVDDSVHIFEVGLEGTAPLSPPPDTEQAYRVTDGYGVETSRGPFLRRRRRRRLAAGVVAALVAIGVGWAVIRYFLPAAKARPTVAVVGFRNFQNDPEREWLANALPEMISTELAAAENLRMIPRESIARMTRELDLPPAGSFARDTLEKIRRNLGTDYVVGGSFLAQQQGEGRRLRLTLHLQETRNGEQLLDTAVEGSETELFELVSRAGELLRQGLGVGGISDRQSAAVRAAMSASPEATQLYSVGLARLRNYDAVGAREALREAVAIDPDYALAHAALSDAWSALGYDREARESAYRASELSEGLPREQVLLIQGRYFEASGQWQEAVDTYQRLWGFFPDNVDHGLRLAAAQDRAGRGGDSLATVAALRQLPPPAGDDPRIDLVEARTADRLSANQLQREAAERAAEKGRTREAWILVAEARYYQGRALRRLGEIAAATAALREAEEKFQQAGDRGMVARSLFQMAIMHHHRGDLVRAEEQYRQALAILREIGNERLISGMLNILATVVRLQGRLTDAEAILAEVPEHARRCGDRLEEAQAMDTLAVVLLARGELAEAETLDRAALTIAEEYGDQTISAWIHFDLGKIFFAAGDLARARASYEKAQQICDEIEYRHLLGHVFHGFGNLLLVEGDLDGAAKMFDDSAAIRRELDEKGYLAEVHLSRAALLLAQERPAEAERWARDAAAEFGSEERLDDQAWATAVVAQALLAQGKIAAARDVLGPAEAHARRSENRGVRLLIAITVARCLAAGDDEAARQRLTAVVAEASERGLVGIELEARLALGAYELRAGEAAAGRERLRSLAREAGDRGFGLIATRAAAMAAT